MNFKLANLSTINQKYGKTIEQMKDATWEIYPIVADAQEIAVPTGCSHKTMSVSKVRQFIFKAINNKLNNIIHLLTQLYILNQL